jgi:hypothetical protein
MPRRVAAILLALFFVGAGISALASAGAHDPPPGNPAGLNPSAPTYASAILHVDGQSPALVVYPSGLVLIRNGTYDLTFTAIPVPIGSAIRLQQPDGSLVPGSRTVSGDLQHCGGTYSDVSCDSPPFANATFPGQMLDAAGDWTLQGDEGWIATFHVAPSRDLSVALDSVSVVKGAPTNLTASVHDSYGNFITNAVAQIVRANGSPAGGDFDGVTYEDGDGGPGRGAQGAFTFEMTPRVLGPYAIQVASNDGQRVGTALFNVTPAPAMVAMSNASAAPGHENVSVLTISNVSDFGAITVTVSYNASVVEVTNVTPGSVPSSTFSWSNDASTGTLRVVVAGSNVPGPSGTLVLASVTLRAASGLGSTTALTPLVNEAVHSDGAALTTQTRSGSFHSWLPGDVNGDGSVDLADAQALADRVVGRVTSGFVAANADVNLDGRISALDVMQVRQYVMRTRLTIG